MAVWPTDIELLLDLAKQISWDYGELLENPGTTLRSLFISEPNGFTNLSTSGSL